MINHQPNDIELIRAFHNNDLSADRIIFDRYFRPLCIYAVNIVGNMQEAEDLVVEVFCKMMANRGKFQTTTNIAAFLYTSTRNAAINLCRNNKRQSLAKEQFGYFEATEILQKDAGQHEIIRLELLACIYREMESLPKKCRTIFKLYFLKGMSSEEIAGLLDISPQTARTQKARAIQIIKLKVFKYAHLTMLLLLTFIKI